MRRLLCLITTAEDDEGQSVAGVELAIQETGEGGGALRRTACQRGLALVHPCLPCDQRNYQQHTLSDEGRRWIVQSCSEARGTEPSRDLYSCPAGFRRVPHPRATTSTGGTFRRSRDTHIS